jgi:hypothetical protein
MTQEENYKMIANIDNVFTINKFLKNLYILYITYMNFTEKDIDNCKKIYSKLSEKKFNNLLKKQDDLKLSSNLRSTLQKIRQDGGSYDMIANMVGGGNARQQLLKLHEIRQNNFDVFFEKIKEGKKLRLKSKDPTKDAIFYVFEAISGQNDELMKKKKHFVKAWYEKKLNACTSDKPKTKNLCIKRPIIKITANATARDAVSFHMYEEISNKTSTGTGLKYPILEENPIFQKGYEDALKESPMYAEGFNKAQQDMGLQENPVKEEIQYEEYPVDEQNPVEEEIQYEEYPEEEVKNETYPVEEVEDNTYSLQYQPDQQQMPIQQPAYVQPIQQPIQQPINYQPIQQPIQQPMYVQLPVPNM